ncbi:MAG TPA: hypothetical protein VGC41_12165, partial [Kofleriaceae bacterium]
AAALPGSRKKALDRIGYELEVMGRATTPRSFDELVKIEELAGECPVGRYDQIADYEGGLAEAKRCGTATQRAEMLFEQGKFADAQKELDATVEANVAIQIAIANADWNHAADLAERYETIPHERAYLTDPEGVAAHQCFGALLRTFGGDANAFARVKDRGHDVTCSIIEAASKPIDQQPDAFAKLDTSPMGKGMNSAYYDLSVPHFALAAGPVTERSFITPSGPGALMFNELDNWVLLAPYQLAAHPDDTWTVTAELNMTGYEAIRGNLAAAHTHFAKIPEDNYSKNSLAMGLALREGTMPPDKPNDAGTYGSAIAIRHGRPVRDLLAARDTDMAELKLAADGDGHALAHLVGTSLNYFDSNQHLVMALLPTLKTGQDEVRQMLHYFRSDMSGTSRMRAITDAALYRDLARLAGDSAEQARWQGVVDRWFATIADRQKLTALLLWQS